MSRDLRIVFMGTPEFAVGILDEMVTAGRNIVGVVTAPDKPAGRGRKVTSSAVKEYALSHNLKVLQPTNLKDTTFLNDLKSLNANLQVVVAFRMLPKLVWQMPEYGTINLHASLLPHYRGAAPINWAIINREKKTGVTTFFIDEKIDTGAVIAKKEIVIENRETAGSLHDKLKQLGGDLVLETLKLIESDIANPRAQSQSGLLLEAPKLTPDNTRIDWTKSGKEIDALIRGLYPYPLAWTVLTDKEDKINIKIPAAHFETVSHDLEPGTLQILKREIKVACPDGYIFIDEIQMAGKRKMDVHAFLNGYTFPQDAKLL